jgi:hypothetical protein
MYLIHNVIIITGAAAHHQVSCSLRNMESSFERTLSWVCAGDTASLTANAAQACGKRSAPVEYATRWLGLIRSELVAEVVDGAAGARQVRPHRHRLRPRRLILLLVWLFLSVRPRGSTCVPRSSGSTSRGSGRGARPQAWS